MRILIISDTHGEDQYFPKILKSTGSVDMLIHAGDFEGSDLLYAQYASIPFFGVAGNNDFLSDVPFEREFSIGPYRTFLTHGHQYNVDVSRDQLYRAAKVRRAQICIYGHTHIPRIERRGKILLLNPGSIAYPRQASRKSSYIILEVDASNQLHPQIISIDKYSV